MRLQFLVLFLTLFTPMMQAKNPLIGKFKTPHQTAPLDKIKNEDYEPAFQEAMAQQRAEIQTIVNNPKAPTFENTIEALERSGALLARTAGIFYALQYAESNDTLMEISQKISPILTEHSNNITLNEALFNRIKTVYDQKEKLALTPEESMLLKNTYESFIRQGAGLQGEQKDRYRKISTELDQLTIRFGQNALKATNAYELLLTDEADLAGLPESIRQAAAHRAATKEKEGWLFDLTGPGYAPFMKYSSVRPLREKLYRAYNSRCIAGEFDNTENAVRIAELRRELGQLMGKENYAAFRLQNNMAGNSERVYELLDDLLTAYKPAALQEVEAVKTFASQYEGKEVELMPWDWSYYAEKLRAEKYDLDDEMLKPYFELEQVKKGVFGLATELYGITFHKNEKIPVYHPEVEAFEVLDADGKFLSVLYTDFHPRASKRGGAWMTNFKETWKTAQGEESRPHVTIVMNFTRPTADKPALLTYDEVETFLHEFGHALHGMLGNTTYASLSGTNVYRDFVELPSQIMENWLGEKEFLDCFAIHYQTGDKIPAELVEKVRNATNYNAAYYCVRQLNFGYLDMAWHTLTQADTVKELSAFEREATQRTQLLPVVENALASPTFNHIFAGGYAAGYYSYKWAEVLDADAFALFKENGIFDQKTATSFRKNILEKGGTQDPMTLYINFRGAEPSVEALMKRDGIMPNK